MYFRLYHPLSHDDVILVLFYELLLDLDVTIEYIKILLSDPSRLSQIAITPTKGSNASTEG